MQWNAGEEMGKNGIQGAHQNGKQGENTEILAYTETAERVMEIATNGEEKRYKNPMQLAMAVSGYEEWSRKTGIEPSYAALAYYLNISKEQLLRYCEDATKYVCYCLGGQQGEIIYAANSEEEVRKYAQGHYFQKQDNNIKIIIILIKLRQYRTNKLHLILGVINVVD